MDFDKLTPEQLEEISRLQKQSASEVRKLAKQQARERIDYLRSLYEEHKKGYEEYLKTEALLNSKSAYNNVVGYHNIKARVKQFVYLNPMKGDKDSLGPNKISEPIQTSLKDLENQASVLKAQLEFFKQKCIERIQANNINELRNIRACVDRFVNVEKFDYSLKDLQEESQNLRSAIDKIVSECGDNGLSAFYNLKADKILSFA